MVFKLEQGVSIITIATDRHRGVGALMKSDYADINHCMAYDKGYC